MRTADYTNQQFGELIAIRRLTIQQQGDKGSFLWELQCSCGRTRNAVPAQLRHEIKSRGSIPKCLDCNPNHRMRRLPVGQAARNEVLRRYKSKAIKAGRVFSLTDDQADILFSSNCFYCGTPPNNHQGHQHHNYNGGFTYNGIDRLNNDIGYEWDNCVACCDMCNKAKRDIPEEDFIEWVLRAAKHIKSRGS